MILRCTLIVLVALLSLRAGMAQDTGPDPALRWERQLATAPHDTGRVNLLLKACYNLNGEGAREAALRFAKEALSLSERLGHARGKANALQAIAAAESLAGHPDRAVQLLRESYVAAETVKDLRLMTSALSSEAREFYRQGVFSKAFDLNIRALKLADRSRDTSMSVYLIGAVGEIYRQQQDTAKALEFYGRAVRLATASGQPRTEYRMVNNLGSLYQGIGNNEMALECFGRCLSIGRQLNDAHLVAFSLNNIGSTRMMLETDSLVMPDLLRALHLRDSIGDRMGMAISHNSIAEFHHRRGRSDSALAHYSHSLAIYGSMGNVMQQVHVRKSMFHIQRQAGRWAEASASGRKALEQARDADLKTEVQEIAISLYEFYKELGRTDSALHMFELGDHYRISMRQDEAAEALVRKQFEYEMERKDEQAAQQLVRTRQERYALLSGLALVMGLAGVSYRSYRIKRRDNAIITQQKQEVERQKTVVDQRNADIMQSFEYARRLQEAVLPPQGALSDAFPDSFLIYLPRDVVSGDFYWTTRLSRRRASVSKSNQEVDEVWLAVGDCTGHGVPGAMLSVMGLNSLNHCVADLGLERPKDVLQQMTLDLLVAFEGSVNTVRDGMDLALCRLDRQTMTLSFAGANSSALIVRDSEAHMLSYARRPVGHHDGNAPFVQHEFQLRSGDRLYLMSDGFPDQQGGPQGKKYLSKRLRELITRFSDRPMQEQQALLMEEFHTWKGHYPQTDDVCLMGVRV